MRLLDIHKGMESVLIPNQKAPIPFFDGCQAIEYDEIFSYRSEPCHLIFAYLHLEVKAEP